MVADSKLRRLDSEDTGPKSRQHMGRLGQWRDLLREDIETIHAKDPAARSFVEVVTSYPGLHAIWLHRIAHGLWTRNHLTLARFLSHISRFLTGIEIHPGARIGRRFFIDHGSGVVIGETAEVGNDVLMYQGAVLGGTSSEHTKRHPTVGNDVVIGAHAVILGSITVGDGAKVGSGSVVIESVPAGATVVGVPGRVTRINGRPPEERRQDILEHGHLPDPVVETLKCLGDRVAELEKQVRVLNEAKAAQWDGDLALACAWLQTENARGPEGQKT
jgi:serine O-acetyltransferase